MKRTMKSPKKLKFAPARKSAKPIGLKEWCAAFIEFTKNATLVSSLVRVSFPIGGVTHAKPSASYTRIAGDEIETFIIE